jgi:hypothetical protein
MDVNAKKGRDIITQMNEKFGTFSSLIVMDPD